MRSAIVAAALVAGVAAVPWDRKPGRWHHKQQDVRPHQTEQDLQTETDCEVQWVTVEESGLVAAVTSTDSNVETQTFETVTEVQATTTPSSFVETDSATSSISDAVVNPMDASAGVGSPSDSDTEIFIDPIASSVTSTLRGSLTQTFEKTTAAGPTTMYTSAFESASPPPSVTSDNIPSETAGAPPAYSTPEESEGAPPAYTTPNESPATTAAGSTPFPYPSGVVNFDGYDYSYSAPVDILYTKDVNSAEHATIYTITEEDSNVRTTSTVESTCTTAEPDYVKEALDVHNEKRAAHSANPVVWDDKLACIAQRQGEYCIMEHLTYVNGGDYGQNLAQGGGLSLGGSMDMWYNEEANFTSSYGEQDAFSKETGHFTQMVWAYTTSIGCATVECSGNPLTVCNYFGAGNMGGFFGVNVLPPTGGDGYE